LKKEKDRQHRKICPGEGRWETKENPLSMTIKGGEPKGREGSGTAC